MLYRVLVIGLFVFALGGLAFAADEAGKEEGSSVAAEVEPGSNGDVVAAGNAHATADGSGGADPEPYETALHGNAGPNQTKPEEWKKSLSLWTLVVFGLLMGILWKFAWGPLRDALDGRESAIQADIDAAKEQNEKAAALLADHQASLAGTADEVRRILDEARRDAETHKQQILAEAQTAAKSEKNRALQEIGVAKNAALQELAEKSVDTAVGLAGRIVERQLSAADHASLISEAIMHFPSKN